MTPPDITLGATIYTVFFAISWGTYANALPRWKPFHYSMIHHAPPRNRVLLSWLMLNIVPWALFALDLAFLQLKPVNFQPTSIWSGVTLVARAVIPGLVPFGCYRLWLAIVQACPDCFYYLTQEKVPPPYGRTCPRREQEANTPSPYEQICRAEEAANAPLREPDRRSLGLLSAREGGWGGMIADAGFGLLFAVGFSLLPMLPFFWP